ncbi:hypothetical protein [Persicobacter psychrovividus]|uniref:Uncharacterized protein n=1 Tax=Persicobacter psychrovividus TaxID=387638 RepID=A0ABN6L8P3_9BACT|nr:hypothetical protein PEPS_18400 [Persicobacter psychrovividus]
MTTSQIEKINAVIATYFEQHPEANSIPVKLIMPDMVQAGVFAKDVKKGMPFRKVLKALDKQGELQQIPAIYADRHEDATYWYLVREGKTFSSPAGVRKEPKEVKKEDKLLQVITDGFYLVNIANELLGKEASSQHKFSFLLGDYHKDGKSRTALPIDAYYEELNMAIEFIEKQPIEFKSTRMTVSGVTRGEQRAMYDQRKRTTLAKEGIAIIDVPYADFRCDEKGKLVRDLEADTKLMREFLADYIKEEEA